MNIIQAREAAMAGKTVVSPNGFDLVHYSFDDMEMISREWVFGEWSIKQDPVRFDAVVELADASLFGSSRGLISDKKLYPLRDKKVRVTVEVLP